MWFRRLSSFMFNHDIIRFVRCLFFFKDITRIMCILYLNGLIKTGAEISFVLSSAYPRWEKKMILLLCIICSLVCFVRVIVTKVLQDFVTRMNNNSCVSFLAFDTLIVFNVHLVLLLFINLLVSIIWKRALVTLTVVSDSF